MRCTSCRWGDECPASAPRGCRRPCRRSPRSRSICRRPSSGSSGSSTTGAPRPCGPKGSSRWRSRTAAISTCCRSARSPSTTRTTHASARSLRAAPPPRVRERGETVAGLARWRDDALVVAAALLPLALFVARERQIAGAAGFPLDDSWIHLHFARNLAAGAGFSYNPGMPIAGSTAPLWTLLLGAGAAVASPSLAMAKAIGVAATLAAALVTRRAALAWGAPAGVALGASIALIWMGPVTWGALSGMEVSLAALLVAAALLAHAHDRSPDRAALASAVCAALAVLARPEALLLVPFL